MRRLIFLAAIGILSAPSVLAQGGSVSGVVREDSTGRVIAGAEVVIEKIRRQTVTDADGRYTLGDLPSGTQLLLVRRLGYIAASGIVQIASGETRTKDLTLTRTPTPLDTVKVTAQTKMPGVGLAGFEDRKRLGFGHFIDSTFLKDNEHRLLSDIMRNIPGVELKNPPICGQPYSVGTQRFIRRINCVASRRYLVALGSPECAIQVMVDGTTYIPGRRIDNNEPARDPSNDWTTTYDISSFQVSDLVAMEVYRRSSVPMEYRGYGAECGLVLLWTKRGRR